ncbi:MAG: orotate phosphoribosyltransferase [Candidatus Omnitrophica bacterium]|nr:orotate phosphoribosyltransferase [Candidatus Omnitrophota bacterium]
MADEKRIEQLKVRLSALLEKEALKRGRFVLSSGKESTYYLDGRIISLTPEGAYLIASIILEMMREEMPDAFGGPTLGADPIVGAVCALSHIEKMPLKSFIVRKEAKGHGTQKQVEGPLPAKGATVVLTDDVATTGKALIEAKQALDRIGVVCREAIVLVDRLEGAAANCAQVGVKLRPIFTIKDFGL